MVDDGAEETLYNNTLCEKKRQKNNKMLNGMMTMKRVCAMLVLVRV
jgi:hypothetical protein